MRQFTPGFLYKFPVKCLQKIGYLTDGEVTKTAALFMLIAATLATFTMVLSMVQLLFITTDIFGFVDNSECLGAHIQVIGKIILLLYRKEKIKHLISLSKEFWNCDMCTKETQQKVNAVSESLYKLQRIFLCAYILCLTFMGVPVIFFGKSLPMGVWQIKNQPELYLVFVVLMQIFLLYYGVVVGSLDSLFMGFCVELALQFKILCDGIEKLSVEEIHTEKDLQVHYDKLKKFIRYHKFLISCLRELRSIFSSTLMIQYMSTVPLVCTALFASMESPNFVFIVRLAITGFCEFLQLALYCIAAEYVSNDVSKVSIAVYNSDWYSQHFKILKIPINLFLQVSQQDVEFIALGLIKINANTMVNVFRLAMSTNTILRNIRQLS